MSRRHVSLFAGGFLRRWGSVLLLTAAGAVAAFSVRARTPPVTESHSMAKTGVGSSMEADTNHLADHHLWITVRLPAIPGKPPRTVRYDAYRQVLSHYGD